MPARTDTPAATTTTPETPETTPPTTADKVLDAVREHPGATSAEFAAAAGLGRSTAAKTLTALAKDGRVTRTPGIRDGGTRAPDQWHPVPADDDQIPAERPIQPGEQNPDRPPGRHTPAAKKRDKKVGRATSATINTGAKVHKTGAAPSDGPEPGDDAEAAAGGKQRLKAGALRGQVEQYLNDHPEDHYTPTQLGHLLGRSSGAIANALEKLVADNYAILMTPKPRTYGAAPPE